MNLREKYGEWGIVCGGSQGQGGAYANKLAEGGMNVVIVGRTQKTIDEKIAQLKADYSVEARGLCVNLGSQTAPEQIIEGTKDLEISFLVYNAGLANVEEFKDMSIEYEMFRLNCNVRTMLYLTLYYTKPMVARGKGGIIIVGSDGGVIGAPYIATYSASKAYEMNLGEALWGELKAKGIDVLVPMPGNTIGQNYSDVPAGTPGFQTGAEVAEEAFSHLGEYPSWICGEWNREAVESVWNADRRRDCVLFYKQVMEENTDVFGTGFRAEIVK